MSGQYQLSELCGALAVSRTAYRQRLALVSVIPSMSRGATATTMR